MENPAIQQKEDENNRPRLPEAECLHCFNILPRKDMIKVKVGYYSYTYIYKRACCEECLIKYIDDLSTEDLIGLANELKVQHNSEQWLDDEWPDKEDDLRVDVEEEMRRVD